MAETQGTGGTVKLPGQGHERARSSVVLCRLRRLGLSLDAPRNPPEQLEGIGEHDRADRFYDQLFEVA